MTHKAFEPSYPWPEQVTLRGEIKKEKKAQPVYWVDVEASAQGLRWRASGKSWTDAEDAAYLMLAQVLLCRRHDWTSTTTPTQVVWFCLRCGGEAILADFMHDPDLSKEERTDRMLADVADKIGFLIENASVLRAGLEAKMQQSEEPEMGNREPLTRSDVDAILRTLGLES
jgi:hypothetical protein